MNSYTPSKRHQLALALPPLVPKKHTRLRPSHRAVTLGHHGASNTADLVTAGNHNSLTKHDDADAKLSVETLRWGLQLIPLCREKRTSWLYLDVKPPKLTRKIERPQRMTGPVQMR